LNKARTETKNRVRSARTRSARLDPDVRLGVFSFKSSQLIVPDPEAAPVVKK
jgi:hypothetical protein